MRGSIRETLPSTELAAQTIASPKVMKLTPAPVTMLLVTGCGPGSMRHTRPSFSPVAQTDPAPTAIPSRRFAPTGIVWPTRLVRGSIRVTAERSASTNQTPASPAAIVLARAFTVATLPPVLGSIREIVWSGLIAQTAPAPTAMPGKPTVGH